MNARQAQTAMKIAGVAKVRTYYDHTRPNGKPLAVHLNDALDQFAFGFNQVEREEIRAAAERQARA